MSIESIMSSFGELSFSDKLRTISEIATLLRKEGSVSSKKTNANAKASKSSKSKDSDAPKVKRVQAVGTRAWMAFVKHCKLTMADRFTETTKEPERLTICKAIRAEDPSAYEAFVAEFKTANSVTADSEIESIASAEVEAEVEADAEEKPTKAKAKPAKAVEDVKAKPAKDVEKAKPAKAAEAAKPTASKADASANAKPKKVVKKAEKKVEKKAEANAEADEIPRITINGKEYFHMKDTNGLFKVGEDNTFGAWVGYYQPDNEEEPIRFTEADE